MRVAGIMSGTSLDGIDVAIVDIRGAGEPQVETIGFTSTPYPAAVRAAILAVSNAATHTAAISRLNFRWPSCTRAPCWRAVEAFGPVELIGCHGQTIYHEGRSNTLQIGEGGGDRRAHRHPGGLRFPRARHRGRRKGRAAGAVRRLPAVPPSARARASR